MFKKILISIIAVLTLGSTFAFSPATVSASRRTTQAQLEKMEYTGKAKTIPKGAHICISSGVGPWNFINT